MKPDQDKIQFEKEVTQVGNSDYILIPSELKKKLKITESTELSMQLEEGEHGIYVSMWNPVQQAEGEE